MLHTIAGVRASLRWGYHEAAALGPWTITVGTEGRHLTATVVEADPFRLQQRPLVFVAEFAQGAWRWPVQALEVTPGGVVARLGATT